MRSTLLQLAVLLLTLHCCIPLASCQNYQQTADLSNIGINVGSTVFKGSKLPVFELDGVQAAQPRIQFTGHCSSLRYNRLYLRYQLSVPMHVDDNTLAKPLDDGKKLGHVTITGIELQLDAGLTGDKAKVTALMKQGKSESWQLIFLCDTFSRCQGLRDELLSYPWTLKNAVRFTLIGRLHNTEVRFPAISSANGLNLRDCHRGRWFVIQKRVDENLSFAKNWDSYEKGFGNPRSNYWIGLESLFAITATKDADKVWKNGETAICQMRMEAEGLDGRKYWSQYANFQVLGPDQNYRLRIGGEVAGSTINAFVGRHNEAQFSTYDRDHDRLTTGSCSQIFGFGGWWYSDCIHLNPNSAYTRKNVHTSIPTYPSIISGTTWLQIRKSVMKLKCE